MIRVKARLVSIRVRVGEVGDWHDGGTRWMVDKGRGPRPTRFCIFVVDETEDSNRAHHQLIRQRCIRDYPRVPRRLHAGSGPIPHRPGSSSEGHRGGA